MGEGQLGEGEEGMDVVKVEEGVAPMPHEGEVEPPDAEASSGTGLEGCRQHDVNVMERLETHEAGLKGDKVDDSLVADSNGTPSGHALLEASGSGQHPEEVDALSDMPSHGSHTGSVAPSSLFGKQRRVAPSSTKTYGFFQEDSVYEGQQARHKAVAKQTSMLMRRKNLFSEGILDSNGINDAEDPLVSPTRGEGTVSPTGGRGSGEKFGSSWERRSLLLAPAEEEIVTVQLSEGEIEAKELVDEREQVLKKLYRSSVMEASGLSEETAKQLAYILNTSIRTHWVFSPTPLLAFLCRRVFIAALTLVALLTMLSGDFASLEADESDSRNLIAMRITALRTRGGEVATTPNFAGVGIIQRDCRLLWSDVGAEVSASGTMMTARFSEPIGVSGYFIETSTLPPEFDPTCFLVEAMHQGDDATEWKVVGGSGWRRNVFGDIIVDADTCDDWSLLRGHTVTYSFARSWPYVLMSAVMPLGIGFILFIGMVLAAFKRPRKAAFFVGIVATLFSGANLLSAIGYTIEGSMDSAIMMWSLFAIKSACFPIVGLKPILLMETILLYGCLAMFCFTIFHNVFESAYDSYPNRYSSIDFLVAAMCVLSGLSAVIVKELTIRKISKWFLDDSILFKGVWDDLIRDKAEEKTLNDINSICSLMKLVSGSPAELHQQGIIAGSKIQRRSEAAPRGSVFSGLVSVFSENSPVHVVPEDHVAPGPSVGDRHQARVTNFHELHVAAQCLKPYLKMKVKEWAEISGGKFPLKYKDGVYVRWESAMLRENNCLKDSIAWTPIKDSQRALEKAIVCYSGDFFRLTDLCRESIVFEHFLDLYTCLEDIASDPEVQVVRVVNRLDSSYNSDDSLGYRFIKINLRIKTEETARLKIAPHICEVQLLMAQLRDQITFDGHTRFLTFRNLQQNRGFQLSRLVMSVFAPKQAAAVQVEVTEAAGYRPSEAFLVARSGTKMIRPPPNNSWCSQAIRESRSSPHRRDSNISAVMRASSMTMMSVDISGERQDMRRLYSTCGQAKAQDTDSSRSAENPLLAGDPQPSTMQLSREASSPKTNTSASTNAASPVTQSIVHGSVMGGLNLQDQSTSSLISVEDTNRHDNAKPTSMVGQGEKRPEHKTQQRRVSPLRRLSLRSAEPTAFDVADPLANDDGTNYDPKVIMERQFIRSVKNKERLDKSLNNWETAMRGASTASAFFTTAPLTTALCKRDAQLGALVIGCAWFALAIFIGMIIGFGMRPNIAADRFYRFTALELRSGVHIMQPSISAFQILTEEIYDNAFQILTKNCHADDLRSSKLRPTTISVTPTTTNVYYDYLMDPKPILHGFLLQTNRNDPGGDPSRFSVEMSFDNVTWSVIGGSSWTFGEDKKFRVATDFKIGGIPPIRRSRRTAIFGSARREWLFLESARIFGVCAFAAHCAI